MSVPRFFSAVCFWVLFNFCVAEQCPACIRLPLPEALDFLNSTVAVEVKTVQVDSWDNISPAPADDNFYYVFRPRLASPTTGFIILPGGNCDPRSYAPAAHALAEKGFWTCIVPMPGCVAVLGTKRAGKVIADNSDNATDNGTKATTKAHIKKWAIGGHSVGGLAASMYAVINDRISGLVIWACEANPDPSKKLANSTIKALSVYGELDGHAPPEDIMANAEYLPPDTVFKEIMGGNHTQFGYIDTSTNTTPAPYLDGDNPATITLQEQQRQIVQATADFLKQFNQNTCPVMALFGSNDPRTETIARFRDKILAGGAVGRSIIACYERNGAAVIGLFDRYPLMKKSAGAALEMALPVLEMFL